MISRNKNVQLFFDYTKKQIEILGVKVVISKKKYISFIDSKCAGYFSPGDGKNEPPTLAVATGRGAKEWLPVFVHESCHLDQWMENSKIWKKYAELDILDEWVYGKKFDKNILNKSTKNSINLEVDCEKRTVKKIIEWNLPIDIDEYIQRSNAYVMFYNYVKKVRKWSDPDKTPFRNKRIFKHMPKTWLDNYHYLSPEIE